MVQINLYEINTRQPPKCSLIKEFHNLATKESAIFLIERTTYFTSFSVLNKPQLKRTVPSGNVPIVLCAEGKKIDFHPLNINRDHAGCLCTVY